MTSWTLGVVVLFVLHVTKPASCLNAAGSNATTENKFSPINLAKYAPDNDPSNTCPNLRQALTTYEDFEDKLPTALNDLDPKDKDSAMVGGLTTAIDDIVGDLNEGGSTVSWKNCLGTVLGKIKDAVTKASSKLVKYMKCLVKKVKKFFTDIVDDVVGTCIGLLKFIKKLKCDFLLFMLRNVRRDINLAYGAIPMDNVKIIRLLRAHLFYLEAILECCNPNPMEQINLKKDIDETKRMIDEVETKLTVKFFKSINEVKEEVEGTQRVTARNCINRYGY